MIEPVRGFHIVKEHRRRRSRQLAEIHRDLQFPGAFCNDLCRAAVDIGRNIVGKRVSVFGFQRNDGAVSFIDFKNAVRGFPGDIGNGIAFITGGNRGGSGRNSINERFFHLDENFINGYISIHMDVVNTDGELTADIMMDKTNLHGFPGVGRKIQLTGRWCITTLAF